MELACSGYRKGTVEAVAADLFKCHPVQRSNGKEIFDLADIEVLLGASGVSVRQVTRRQPNGHQTHIVTSRRDLAVEEVAKRMFDRWRQENFFNSMRQQYAIDALVDDATAHADADREMPNPQLNVLNKAVADVALVLAHLAASAERVVVPAGFALAGADRAPDPDDVGIAELAAFALADAVVTGNSRHFQWARQRGSLCGRQWNCWRGCDRRGMCPSWGN